MSQAFILQQETEVSALKRCQAFRNVFNRVLSIGGDSNSGSSVSNSSAIKALRDLAEKNLLTTRANGDVIDILYVPSKESKQNVYSKASPGTWAGKLADKHAKAFRTTPGAIFHLPRVGKDGFIDAFITDWSPFPAAAAVAIHKDHTVAKEVGSKEGNYFTGEYVRHPLTGDLLPVWVGEWVKPEFGTGGVIVNPAHDNADLKFAKEFGLPIRFGLIPNPVTSDPNTWPTPPVIKQGLTVKTGRFDGLSVHEAVEAYFNDLSANGFAERHVDLGIGAWKIGSFVYQPNEEVFFNPGNGRFTLREEAESSPDSDGGTGGARSISLSVSELLTTLLDLDKVQAPVLIVSAAEVETTLLFARLLFFDLTQKPLLPADVKLVQRIEATKASKEANEDDVITASVTMSAGDQIASIKQQDLEQIERFRNVHNEFCQTLPAMPLPERMEGNLWKSIQNAKRSILAGDLKTGFATLYSVQKQLRSLAAGGDFKEPALTGYYVVTHALMGYSIPDGIDFSESWGRI